MKKLIIAFVAASFLAVPASANERENTGRWSIGWWCRIDSGLGPVGWQKVACVALGAPGLSR